jgi:hypothetical protein
MVEQLFYVTTIYPVNNLGALLGQLLLHQQILTVSRV